MRVLKTLLFLSLISALILPSFKILAEDSASTLSVENEVSIESAANSDENKSLDPLEERKALEEELKKLEEQIAQYEGDIAKTGTEKKTLQNQISVLKKKVEKLDLQIQESNVIIKDIGFQIKDTETSIEKTSSKIKDSRIQLANILQDIYEEDQRSLLEILLSEKELSDFFDNLMDLEVLNSKNQELLETIKNLKSSLESEKQSLSEDKDDTEKALKIQTLQKKESESTKKEKDYLKNKTEAQYQQYLKEKQELEKRAAEIMARITQLTMPGTEVPKSKEELYELASWAGNLTKVRPALILGLIEVESALGTNVGQCNCAGQPYCRHPDIGYKQVMGSSQWDAFLKITKELGLNSTTTPVSCYVEGGMVQMGGAMGPAQFMPNTWLNLGYKARVESITGVVPANPWRARDAFLAAGLYLADNGADTQIRTNEMGAATAYLCGTTIMTSRCRRAGGVWYTNTVMDKAKGWQEWINEGTF